MSSPVYEALSAQDASFVFFEHRATHMHVAALAIFEVGPLRSATGGVDGARLALVIGERALRLSYEGAGARNREPP